MIRIEDMGTSIKIGAERPSLHWASYDLDGQRIKAGSTMCAPTSDELATWDAEAALVADAILATAAAPKIVRPVRWTGILVCRRCGSDCYGDCTANGY